MSSVALAVRPPLAEGAVWPSTALAAPGRRYGFASLAALALASALMVTVAGEVQDQRRRPELTPVVVDRPAFASLFDTTPVLVTETRLWIKFSTTVPRWMFLADHARWQRMHFEDWDQLDSTTRAAGLSQLLARYGDLVDAPATWRRMSALEWDEVPQPLRAMAIVGMIEHWTRFYEVGVQYGLDPVLVSKTAKAIAMSESWFDHRAVHANRDASRDIGLGGASDFARETLRRLFSDGAADFTLTDEQYFNPWFAARWLAFWLDLTLRESHGDLDLATRAYNVGIGRARAGAGAEYLAGVQRRRARYFEGPSHSPTWATLSQFRRDRRWLPPVVVRPPLASTAWTPVGSRFGAFPPSVAPRPPVSSELAEP